jgi:hypothetical protein
LGTAGGACLPWAAARPQWRGLSAAARAARCRRRGARPRRRRHAPAAPAAAAARRAVRLGRRRARRYRPAAPAVPLPRRWGRCRARRAAAAPAAPARLPRLRACHGRCAGRCAGCVNPAGAGRRGSSPATARGGPQQARRGRRRARAWGAPRCAAGPLTQRRGAHDAGGETKGPDVGHAGADEGGEGGGGDDGELLEGAGCGGILGGWDGRTGERGRGASRRVPAAARCWLAPAGAGAPAAAAWARAPATRRGRPRRAAAARRAARALCSGGSARWGQAAAAPARRGRRAPAPRRPPACETSPRLTLGGRREQRERRGGQQQQQGGCAARHHRCGWGGWWRVSYGWEAPAIECASAARAARPKRAARGSPRPWCRRNSLTPGLRPTRPAPARVGDTQAGLWRHGRSRRSSSRAAWRGEIKMPRPRLTMPPHGCRRVRRCVAALQPPGRARGRRAAPPPPRAPLSTCLCAAAFPGLDNASHPGPPPRCCCAPPHTSG